MILIQKTIRYLALLAVCCSMLLHAGPLEDKGSLIGLKGAIELHNKANETDIQLNAKVDSELGGISTQVKKLAVASWYNSDGSIKEQLIKNSLSISGNFRDIYWTPEEGCFYKLNTSKTYLNNSDVLASDILEIQQAIKAKWTTALKTIDSQIARYDEEIKRADAERAQGVTTALDGAKDVFKNMGETQKAEAMTRQQGKNMIKNLKYLMTQGDKIAMGLIAIAGGSYFIKKSFDLIFSEVEKFINAPQLIKKTTRPSDPWEWAKQKLFGRKKEESRLAEFKAPEEFIERLINLIDQTQRAKEMKMPYKNILLYGPPGTGKTMFAEILAKESGLEYAMFSGADFDNFEHLDGAMLELEKIIKWAENSRDGILVFVDEAECFLLERRLPDTDPRSRALTNKYLSMVDKPSSDKIMWVFASNNRGALDVAVESRIAESFEMRLPSKETNASLLFSYLEKNDLFADTTMKDGFYQHLHLLNGFSGRDTEEIANEISRLVNMSGKTFNLNLVLETIELKRLKNSSFVDSQKVYQKARYGKNITVEAASAAPAV